MVISSEGTDQLSNIPVFEEPLGRILVLILR
jgi:hypothetical protein